MWCRDNNLLLNTSKTKEVTIDSSRKREVFLPPTIGGDCVERVADLHFLGLHIEEDLTWSVNTSELLKKGPAETALPEGTEEEHLTETAGGFQHTLFACTTAAQ